MKEKTVLGANVARGIQHFGYPSARAFAIQSGVNYDTLRGILDGKSKTSRGDTLEKIARTLRVSVEDLLRPDLDFSVSSALGVVSEMSAQERETAEALDRQIGARLRAVRVARMRRDDPEVVAAELGWALPDLLAYEAGAAPMPPHRLATFCGQFVVSPSYLLFGDEEGMDLFLRKELREVPPEG